MSDRITSAGQPQSRLNPVLERLDVFVGEWDLEFTRFHADPSAVAHGRSSFY